MNIKSQQIVLTVSSLLASVFTGCAPKSTAPQSIGELDTYIANEVQASQYPGFSVAIVVDDKMVWSKGYGVTNLQTRAPVTADTPFMLASVSKVVTGTALMQLVETGKIDLDADINTYLPFNIQNPRANGKITLRHLATHTSGLMDNKKTLAASYGVGDSNITLEEFLKSYFTPTGSRYDAKLNFTNSKPGTQYEYSNIAIGLAAYLLERQTGGRFDQYTNEHIFKPLGMNNTHWFLHDFKDPNSIAFPYDSQYPELTHYGYPTYPDGQLRSSANDMAKFLATMMNGGTLGNTQILERKTLSAMLEPQFPDVPKEQAQGLFWTFKKGGLIGHAGGDPGAGSYLYWNPDTHIGTVVMFNTALTENNTAGVTNILKTIVRDPQTVQLFR
jgi:CubicO group peptidase (beta-lactamase class C family)